MDKENVDRLKNTLSPYKKLLNEYFLYEESRIINRIVSTANMEELHEARGALKFIRAMKSLFV